jgi:hypothetical protein
MENANDFEPSAAADQKYTVQQIESSGVQAVGTFYGTYRQGWLLGDDQSDFVDYAGFAQIVIPAAQGNGVVRKIWHPESAVSIDLEFHGQPKPSVHWLDRAIKEQANHYGMPVAAHGILMRDAAMVQEELERNLLDSPSTGS